MFEKQTTVDLIETVANGCIQVRTKIIKIENGVEISSQFHRHVVAPGDDYSNETAEVQAICAAVHTAEVIATYQATIATQGV